MQTLEYFCDIVTLFCLSCWLHDDKKIVGTRISMRSYGIWLSFRLGLKLVFTTILVRFHFTMMMMMTWDAYGTSHLLFIHFYDNGCVSPCHTFSHSIHTNTHTLYKPNIDFTHNNKQQNAPLSPVLQSSLLLRLCLRGKSDCLYVRTANRKYYMSKSHSNENIIDEE